MDQSEESPQQQYIPSGAGQMVSTRPPFNATRYNVGVPMFSTMQPPPLVSASQHQLVYQPPRPLVSASQLQLAHQEAQAQHMELVRERLRQFWANQMQEMKPEELKKHNLPLAPINRIMKADKDVKMIAKETTAVFSKACEMFILDLTSQAWINTEEEGRRTVQNKDIAAAIHKTDLYDFLEEVIPRHQLNEQNLKVTNSRQHVGSSTDSTIPNNIVPQLPPPFMPFYQPGPQNHQTFVPGPQSPSQQNQWQPSMSWPQAQYLQQPFMPWPQAHSQQNQQPSMPWPQTQDHTPEQSPMSWLQDELIPDQENSEQEFHSSPQDEEIPDQDQNDE
ncbi:Nuclear transcription factor Y subunit C-2 [Heracleum sosnowskyi]|uniref:Nuclear transcription factor Y subunit C-2 n=1 Tax=Heracleum sosnowskyi TaxID=360622 RepID=A0AAD8MCJ7_9APIA|nr:Nuclear transcription factor Y subunit C-2 [Heracleum sosnowskyi]